MEPALPESRVISYFATVSSPTRVRRLARTGLRLTAIFSALCAMAGAGYLGWAAFEGVIRGAPMGRFLEDYRLLILAFTIMLGCALAQWLSAPGVELGSIRACQLVNPTLMPAIFMLWVLCAFPEALTFAAMDLRWPLIVRLFLAMLCVIWFFAQIICSLLIMDLSRFVKWIANHPTTEKPPMRFLSLG